MCGVEGGLFLFKVMKGIHVCEGAIALKLAEEFTPALSKHPFFPFGFGISVQDFSDNEDGRFLSNMVDKKVWGFCLTCRGIS